MKGSFKIFDIFVYSKIQSIKIKSISKKLHQKFPDGFTVIATWGKTRTTFSMLQYLKLLDKYGKIPDDYEPGVMDVKEYALDILDLYGKHMLLLKDLGVSDIIITLLHYEAWTSRGDDYIKSMLCNLDFLVNDVMVKYYNQGFTPYFIGLDIIYRFYPKNSEEYKQAKKLEKFEKTIKHKKGNVYLGLELFPINSYTSTIDLINKIKKGNLDKFINKMDKAKNPLELEDFFYNWQMKILCKGRYIPRDSLLIGSCYSGDLHIRSTLDSAAIFHKRQRLFFYPGPSMLMTPDTYIKIFEDVVGDKKAIMRSSNYDHRKQNNKQIWENEIKRALDLMNNPNSVIGLLR